MFIKSLLDVLFDYNKNISDLLEGLSCTAHLAFFLWRQNKAAFIPGQLYHDLQQTIRCAFVVVAQAKVVCPTLQIYLFQLGTDNVENLFAILRTMTHARTFSYVELVQRLGHAVQVQDIWSRHPEWGGASKRLRLGTDDHMNTKTWDTGPAGNTSVIGVDLVACWRNGRRNSVTVLQNHPEYTKVTLAYFMNLAENVGREGKVSMFFPNG